MVARPFHNPNDVAFPNLSSMQSICDELVSQQSSKSRNTKLHTGEPESESKLVKERAHRRRTRHSLKRVSSATGKKTIPPSWDCHTHQRCRRSVAANHHHRTVAQHHGYRSATTRAFNANAAVQSAFNCSVQTLNRIGIESYRHGISTNTSAPTLPIRAG